MIPLNLVNDIKINLQAEKQICDDKFLHLFRKAIIPEIPKDSSSKPNYRLLPWVATFCLRLVLFFVFLFFSKKKKFHE